MSDIGLIVVDPGHFHAALAQKEMYPNLSSKVHVYAPVGPDLADYLSRIARFNARKEQPTYWQLEVHAGPDFLERMCRERPGAVAIFSGRNRGKAQRILAAVEAGINVLADKPLIVDRQELPVLEAALNAADERGLIHSTLFSDQAIDYWTDIRLHAARRWPTMISAPQFRQVTGEASWPDYLAPCIREDALEYFCNTRLQYEIRGVHIAVETRWDWEAAEGGDAHTACYRGSRARLELRQGAAEGYRSELYIVPVADIATAIERRIAALQTVYPGVGLVKLGREWRLSIPDALRTGHEEHFARMTRHFLDHVEQRRSPPTWEKPNTLAKYYVCTEGVALSQG